MSTKSELCIDLNNLIKQEQVSVHLKCIDAYSNYLKLIGQVYGWESSDAELEDLDLKKEFSFFKRQIPYSFKALREIINDSPITKERLKQYDDDVEIKDIIEKSKFFLGLINNYKNDKLNKNASDGLSDLGLLSEANLLVSEQQKINFNQLIVSEYEGLRSIALKIKNKTENFLKKEVIKSQ